MKIPGFTAAASLTKHRQAFRAPSRRAGRIVSPLECIEPAARDAREQDYQECLAECRRAGLGNCYQRCHAHTSGGSSSGPTTNTSPESVVCQVEEYMHPIGAAIMDAYVRMQRDNGTMKSKDDCYKWADLQAGLTGAIASGVGGAIGASVGNVPGGFLGGFLGALVGLNSTQLSHCICDRYFQ
jgi:hypothetical protein